MATARQTQNLIQRNKAATLYKISGSGTRVLGLSTFSNRLATQATDAIDQDYTRRYNDGLITPEEYTKHLEEMISRSGLTPTQRTQVTDSIRDVKRNQQISQLQAAYDAAAPNTDAKVAAANALASFYETQAANLGAGTPAQADAQGNASKWKQQATTLKTSIEKTARTSLRYDQLARVSSLPSNDPQTAMEKAQVYQVLANEAFADGATDEGNRMVSAMNQELERAQKLEVAAQEAQVKEYKGSIVQNMNKVLNDYGDGKVGPYDVLTQLSQAEALADQTGDYTLALRINSARDRIEKDIERQQKAGAGAGKKALTEMLDTIEMDIANLETAFKYGTKFMPQSDFFKQALPQGADQIDLQDLLEGRNVAFMALQNLVQQAEGAGIDIPEGRRSTIFEELSKSQTTVESYKRGTLVTYIDPGSNQIVYQDVDSQEALDSQYFIPQEGGLGAKYAEFKPAAVYNMAQKAFVTTNPNQQPVTINGISIKKRGWFGLDWLAADQAVNQDVPFYRTADGGFAVSAKDLNLSEDPNVYYKVNNIGDRLEIDPDQKVTPAKVITVPSADGKGFDKVFVGVDPITGRPNGTYFSERQNRALQTQELNQILRGRSVEQAVAASSGQEGVQQINPQPTGPNSFQEDVAPPGPAAPQSEISDYLSKHPEFQSTVNQWVSQIPSFSSPQVQSGNFTPTQINMPKIDPNKLSIANPPTSVFAQPDYGKKTGISVDLGSTQGLTTPQPGIPKQPSSWENIVGGFQNAGNQIKNLVTKLKFW